MTWLSIVPVAGAVGIAAAHIGCQRTRTGSQRLRDAVVVGLPIVVVLAVLLGLGHALFGSEQSHPLVALSFVVGAACSAVVSHLHASGTPREGVEGARAVASDDCSQVGLSVMGLGTLGLGLLMLVYLHIGAFPVDLAAADADVLVAMVVPLQRVLLVLGGFGLGASIIALVARVGGGIRAGAAVVGADIFDSFVSVIVAAMILGATWIGAMALAGAEHAFDVVLLPLALACAGILCSVVVTVIERTSNVGRAMRRFGALGVAAMMLATGYVLIVHMLPSEWRADGRTYTSLGVFVAVVVGLVAGVVMGWIKGALPVLVLAVVIVLAFSEAGLYGIAIAGLGMLSIAGARVATDSPVLAVGSTALTALALFAAFEITVMPAGRPLSLGVSEPTVLAGLLLGGMIPFLFTSMTANTVEHEDREARYRIRIRRTISPLAVAVVVPVLAGLASIELLGGLVVGVMVSGFLLAIFLASSGDARVDAVAHVTGGSFVAVGPDAREPTVAVNTIGGAFDHTRGPSLNILVKVMSVVALVVAPLLQRFHFAT
jgi:K(+)-stimulated pyrophosphate-energized sodium pump